jgi:protein arginine kinase
MKTEILEHDSLWLSPQEGAPIIISTRVRLARNLADRPFPVALTAEQAEETEKILAGVMEDLQVGGQSMSYVPLSALSALEKTILMEKHLISPALATQSEGRGVALSPDHSLAVMVNEEDHIRLQVILPGMRFKEAFQLADKLDDALESHLDFAFKEKFGYLTACPTNIGMGLRMSAMMHLPGLVLTQRMQHVIGELAPLGLTVRGLYGEGSKAWGNLFQISNQVTLGKTEEDTLLNLEAVAEQISELEGRARQALIGGGKVLEDKVWRARGTLQNARVLVVEEAFRLLSEDRLGIDLGFLPDVNEGFASLMLNLLPAGLRRRYGEELTENQLNVARADYTRSVM